MIAEPGHPHSLSPVERQPSSESMRSPGRIYGFEVDSKNGRLLTRRTDGERDLQYPRPFGSGRGARHEAKDGHLSSESGSSAAGQMRD